MSKQTLHLCNYSDVIDYESYFRLVTNNDAIVFYGNTISIEHYNSLSNNALILNNKLFFIIDNNTDNLSNISYSDWVDLVDAYKRTFTWK